MEQVGGYQILAHLPGAAFVTDPAGVVTYWNPAAEQLFGWRAAELVGASWWSRLRVDRQPEPKAGCATAGARDEFTSEYLINHPDGRFFWAQLQFRRLSGQDGTGEGWLVLGEDKPTGPISKRRLTFSELQLEAVLDAIHDAVISLDGEGRIVFFNPAAEKVFHYPRRTVLGQLLSSFPPLQKTLQQFIGPATAPPREPVKPQPGLQGWRADGQAFPIEASVARSLINRRGFATVVLRDITLQRQRQQAMTQSQKMLAIGALASGVAHDFNNLLTAILSHLDLMAGAPGLPSGLQNNLTYAQTSARRGAELVSKLLTFSRQTEAKLEPLNLQDLSAEIVAMLRHSIDRRILIRDEVVTPPLWLVRGDSSQLMQVLMNLCINARDAMPQGGDLRLRMENVVTIPPEAGTTATPGEFVKLTVSDTGQGMPPEVLGRLFEPYFTTKSVGKGTGLGLSIAYGVVTEHGGWMEVESKVGQGSRFHVFLPRFEPHVQGSNTATEAAPAADSPALQGQERVLVVDDDEMVRLVIRAVLNYRGYQVAEAADGEEAIEKYRVASPRFDLVLLDLNMPRLNGWDAMVKLRELDPQALIVLLSGGLTGGEIERARTLGAKELLTKPFENPELVRLVRNALDEAKKAGTSPRTEPIAP